MAETDIGAGGAQAPLPGGGTGVGGTTGISPDSNVGVTDTGTTNVGGGDMGTPDAAAVEDAGTDTGDTGAAHDIGNIPGTATPASAAADAVALSSRDGGDAPTGATDAIDADDAVSGVGA